MGTVIVVGCGELGRRVGTLWHRRGSQVYGLARRDATLAAIAAAGLTPVPFDLDHPAGPPEAPIAGALIYYFAPPPTGGSRDTRMRGLVAALDRLLPARLVYLSTTGVYGDCGGAWVDEGTPPAPATNRARRRLDAEQVAGDWAHGHGVPLVILRVPGIYGPGRLPERRLRAGEPVLDPAACGFTNRIHVHDLVRVCMAAAGEGARGIYNVSDGHPGTLTDYLNQAADALGLPRLPVIGPEAAARGMSAAMRSYLAESRRIDNRRMREELGVCPDYPDLTSGLAAGVREHMKDADVSA